MVSLIQQFQNSHNSTNANPTAEAEILRQLGHKCAVVLESMPARLSWCKSLEKCLHVPAVDSNADKMRVLKDQGHLCVKDCGRFVQWCGGDVCVLHNDL